MNRLKACPFCGGEVKRIRGFRGLNFFKCKKCGAVVSFDNDFYNENHYQSNRSMEQEG